jgi:hypothetical protein
VPYDCRVVEVPLELVGSEFETPRRDLVAPAEGFVGAGNKLHLGDHVLHEVGFRKVLVEVEVLGLAQAQDSLTVVKASEPHMSSETLISSKSHVCVGLASAAMYPYRAFWSAIIP